MFRKAMEVYQFFHMVESHHHQRLAWNDAKEARIAKMRAEKQAALQLKAMLEANPSGQLGTSALNDRTQLKRGGLL